MKFEITMASKIFANPKEILATYPKLRQFVLDTIPDRYEENLFITLKDMSELKNLIDTLDNTSGVIINKHNPIGEGEPTYTLCIYDSYVE